MLENVGSNVSQAVFGIDPRPHGTLEELQREGLDPEAIGSCHPQSQGVTRGCPHWNDCPFNRANMGGFKGNGPRNVGYYLRTQEGDQKEDDTSCYSFIRMGMYARMMAGITNRMKGDQRAEVVRIVALEPSLKNKAFDTKITKKFYVPVEEDPVKRQADKQGAGVYKAQVRVVELTNHPRPGEIEADSYDAQLGAQERKRQLAEASLEDASFARVNAVVEREEAEDDVLAPAPVKRGPGRPRKEPLAAEPLT